MPFANGGLYLVSAAAKLDSGALLPAPTVVSNET